MSIDAPTRPAALRRATSAWPATSTLVVGQVLGAAIGLAAEVVIARSLGPSGRGTFAVIMAATQIASVLGAVAFGHVAVREVAASRLSMADARRTAIVAPIPCSLFLGIATALILRAAGVPGYAALASIATIISIVCAATLLNLRQMSNSFISTTVSAWSIVLEKGAFFSLLVLVVVQAPRLDAVLWSGAIATFATALIVGRRLLAVPTGTEVSLGTRSVAASLLRPATKVVGGNLMQFVNYRLDTFLVAAWVGAASAGHYAVAVAFSSVFWYLADAAAQHGYALACADIGAGLRPYRTLRMAHVVVAITAGCGLLALPASQFVFPMLLGDRFIAAQLPFALLIPGVIALSYVKVSSGLLVAVGREIQPTKVALMAAVVTVVADVALIPRFGAAGAAAASSLAYCASAVMTHQFIRRAFPLSDRSQLS